jgi:hypothetical protein
MIREEREVRYWLLGSCLLILLSGKLEAADVTVITSGGGPYGK